MKRLIVAIAVIGGMGALLVFVGAAGQRDFAAAQSASDGAEVYADNCAGCHQADGSGLPGIFPPLTNNPNVADGAYVEQVVREGLSGSINALGETYNSSMPAFQLPDSDLTALVSYVQSLGDAMESPSETAAPAPPEAGAEGAAVYADQCAGCHQADGSGVPGAFPPLANNPNAADGAYVERVILEGLSGPIEVLGETYDSSMPAFPLNDSDLAAVVAHVQSLAGGATPSDTTAAPAPPEAGADGAAVYADQCAGCHQADGSGIPGAFPPLANNPNAADGPYVERVILEGLSGPIEVLGETYDSSMPAFPLNDSDLAAVVSYVQSLAGGAGPSDTTTPTAAPGASAGDAARGEKLFAGSIGFTNRGPACHACHAAGPLGLRGGRGLGPDLTDVAARRGGEAGLSAWLANPGSAIMQPLFADKELTSSEAADVAAYLASIQDESPAEGLDRLLLGGLLGLAILLLMMGALIRRPRETYTDRLRSQS